VLVHINNPVSTRIKIFSNFQAVEPPVSDVARKNVEQTGSGSPVAMNEPHSSQVDVLAYNANLCESGMLRVCGSAVKARFPGYCRIGNSLNGVDSWSSGAGVPQADPDVACATSPAAGAQTKVLLRRSRSLLRQRKLVELRRHARQDDERDDPVEDLGAGQRLGAGRFGRGAGQRRLCARAGQAQQRRAGGGGGARWGGRCASQDRHCAEGAAHALPDQPGLSGGAGRAALRLRRLPPPAWPAAARPGPAVPL